MVEVVGKEVLIKLVISSILVYMGSGLLAPKGIIHQIGGLLRKFLW